MTLNPLLSALRADMFEELPWLHPYKEVGQRVLASAQSMSVAAALDAARDEQCPIRFVRHGALPANEPYETFIAREAAVPTRDNLHDLFNGLVWLTYPLTKQRLNRLQAEQIVSRGIGGTRGPIRDALTVLDENGVFLHAPKAIVAALRAREWRTLFIEHREQWRSATILSFGHALLEKLLQPRKAITAHVWAVDDCGDATLAALLGTESLVPKPLYPMPILGVPGWSRENEAPGFYDDPEVFRTARR